MRVLVVEDERQLADSSAKGLRLHAMAVDVVYDGVAGLDRAGVNDYDVPMLVGVLTVIAGAQRYTGRAIRVAPRVSPRRGLPCLHIALRRTGRPTRKRRPGFSRWRPA